MLIIQTFEIKLKGKEPVGIVQTFIPKNQIFFSGMHLIMLLFKHDTQTHTQSGTVFSA